MKLAGVGREVVCAEDEGHGGEGSLGGEEVLDEDFDGNGCDGGCIMGMLFELVVGASGV